jgi:large subunit ribosomal protein L25
MAKQVQLKAKARSEAGKTRVKKLRDSGLIPAVIYGVHNKPLNLAVAAVELKTALHTGTGENVLVDLLVEEGAQTVNRLALIQEVQHHPVTDAVLHVDFHEVLATEKLRTKVPVRAIGEPAGVKTGGGILEYVMRELHVECLPKDLPDVVEVNVEKLEIGQSIHVGEVTVPAGVELLDDKAQPVFLVVAPITEAEEAALGQPAESGEPEVIGAKLEEGEAGAAAEGDKKADGKPAAGKEGAKPEAGKAEAKPAAGKAEAKPAAAKPAAGKPAAKK